MTDNGVKIVMPAGEVSMLEEFLQVSSTLYEVGQGVQQDVLQAQVSVARMTEDIIVMEQSRTATASRLNALLGQPATAPVGTVELPAGFEADHALVCNDPAPDEDPGASVKRIDGLLVYSFEALQA